MIGEDENLLSLASVELKKLFAQKKITTTSEMSLAANQGREEMEKKRLVWEVEGSKKEEATGKRGGPIDPQKLVVELFPMEIRTFILTLARNAPKGKTISWKLVVSDLLLQ